MERVYCPHCNAPLVTPYGNPDSTILIVGDSPDYDEIKRGVPFVGEAGHVLESELLRAGLDLWTTRMMLFWQHAKNYNPACFEYMLKELTIEMAGRRVLLMGAELCQFFTGNGVMDMAGLEVKSGLFPRSTGLVMISPSPGSVLHTSVGEFRLSLQKFVKRIKEELDDGTK